MKAWNPSRRLAVDRKRLEEQATVLAALEQKSDTAAGLAKRCGFSMFTVRRALKVLRNGLAVTWLPHRSPSNPAHAYQRVYLAPRTAAATSTLGRAKRRRA